MFQWLRRNPRVAEGVSEQHPQHERVARLIAEFRPHLLADGGDIQFLGITGAGVVRVRLRGACVGCPSIDVTLRQGLERYICERISGIRGVESV